MPKPPPNKWGLYGMGAAAPLSVYVVFYASHAQELLSQVRALYASEGFLGLGVVAVLFSLLAAMCGGWALFCESRTYKAAFSAGLGLPALILGGSGSFAPRAEKHTALLPETRPATLAAGFYPMLAATDGGVFGKALALVFNPVGLVLETRETQREDEASAFRQQNAALADQAAKLKSDNQALAARYDTVQGQLSSLNAELEHTLAQSQSAARRVDKYEAEFQDLKHQLSQAQEELTLKQGQLDQLSASATQYRMLAENLQEKMQQANQALASPQENELLVREVRRLRTELADQQAAWKESQQMVLKLAKAAGAKATPILGEGLTAAQYDPTKVLAIETLGAVPQATATPGVKKKLQAIQADASPEVQQAIQKALIP